LKRALAILLGRPAARAALAFIAVLGFAALAVPPILSALGIDGYAIDAAMIYQSPSAHHPLGTDDLGRDVLARLLIGARVSLFVAAIGTLLAIVAGAAIGLLAGWFGGLVDQILSRTTEAMTALPKLPLMIILAAVDLEKIFGASSVVRGSAASIAKLIAIVVLFGWMSAARLARASAIQLRHAEFIEAARALGASDRRIILAHVLPSSASPLAVLAALELGEIIVYESMLSFLGLGISPPTPSWGQMLAKGMTYLESAPLLVVLPGLLTFSTVAAFNVLADHVRDALDPKTAERV
jgi:peptide/nickel transport system permease protein